MESQYLSSILESLLFVSGRPLKAKDLAKILEVDEAAVLAALKIMVDNKKTRGIVLLENKGEYQLSTNSQNSTYVKNFLNAELREKLTDATLEVLSIIAYRQPISKAEIEAIRGVNSQYSVRNLLMRGLIEKVSNPSDARSFLYQTTTEFLMHLGLASINDLPEFEKLVEKIKLPETPALAMDKADQTTAAVNPATEKPADETPNSQRPEKQEAPSAAEEAPEEDDKDEDELDDDDEDDE